MGGCYGDSQLDRIAERRLDEYLDACYPEIEDILDEVEDEDYEEEA